MHTGNDFYSPPTPSPSLVAYEVPAALGEVSTKGIGDYGLTPGTFPSGSSGQRLEASTLGECPIRTDR